MSAGVQLWRVFSPATQEAMPWCSTWEKMAAGALACHLLNEIRAPAPGLDPFQGLDIPLIRNIPQPNCPLLALPPEILYVITDNLHSLTDILSLSLTCNPLLSVCLQKLRVSLHDRMKGAWINTPLICLGSLTDVNADLPPHIQEIDAALELPTQIKDTVYFRTYRSGDRRHTYDRFETTHILLKNYDKFDLSDDRIADNRMMIPLAFQRNQRNKFPVSPLDFLISLTSELPGWTRRLVNRATDLDKGVLRLYSQTANYVVRNLSRKEYIPFTIGKTLKSEIESVFYRSQIIPIDQAVTIVFIFLITWSPSLQGLEDETVRKNVTEIHGLWAGDCFDVCEVEELKDGWRSVEEETLLSFRLYLPKMYKNMYGLDAWGEPQPGRLAVPSLF
ncbi:hypothetical protein TWF225_006560 [Orbilia oligospora]|uniref:Uncharacterized protein n=1 Tax=Orbilia oligospora TaxID=2813651 RepID=A0A7C8P2H7_ORBOL|nr:hypothetical protein TWF751_012064 [Orbilia oligospora]KAF3182065.1 hypothetical protein TWF225_006560 [Orbilia oligospora]KAF3265075.1 hypothetical protein TWF217_002724 [Orbilia oligospora]KAF3268054.1 hypothetical protein TWF128_008068 [Orbilia oligospora]TGJ62403.1 hypothetical protein EYR41_002383 [Orbilia oligospora]